MFKAWDNQFDVVCGAAIKNRESEPRADSMVHDWLYGSTHEVPSERPEDELSGPEAALTRPGWIH